MTQLCAPVKELIATSKVELQEIDYGSHKTIYKSGVPYYLDVDWKAKSIPEGVKVIVSYHNYEETPNLEAVLTLLQKTHPKAHLYKIATKAHSTLDSLRMMEFLRAHPKVIGLCMGDLGSMTRICAPLFHAPLTYAPLHEEDKNAAGQLLADQLCEIFQFRSLNSATQLFGLIGDPVHRSIGHLFHNDYFRRQGLNALYLKMVIKPDELASFFAALQKLPFKGLSVTAPLKEAVLPFIHELDSKAKAIGAVNTLALRDGKIYGYNTDGDAALDVLGDVRGKTMVVLGAGGAARALIYTGVERGAKVVVVNRTLHRAQELAQQFGCAWSEKIPSYDIVVNSTSVPMPIFSEQIVPGSQVMDLALYETDFLKAARLKKCVCIDGFPMYFQQALAQQKIWSAHFTQEVGDGASWEQKT